MAKDKRFPSPANVEVDKEGKPKPPQENKGGPVLEKKVEGKSRPLVKVTHKGDNIIILHDGIRSLAPGENHVDAEVMAESAKHPSIAHLIKSGKLVVHDDKPQAASQFAGEP